MLRRVRFWRNPTMGLLALALLGGYPVVDRVVGLVGVLAVFAATSAAMVVYLVLAARGDR